MAEHELTSLETRVLKDEAVSPIKTKEVTEFINTKFEQQELQNKALTSLSEAVQKPSEGITTIGKKETYPLDPRITIKNGAILYNGEKFGSINESTRVIDIDREKGIDHKGVNTFLSHTNLAPYATYNVNHGLNKTIYKTDGIGRCLNIENIAKETGNLRSINDQVKALRTKNEQTLPNTNAKINDQGGHYIAKSNGGIPESINIFPQAYQLNNSPHFKEMERTINSALGSGSTVKTNIDVHYKGLSFRPDTLAYKVQFDGGEKMEYRFENTNLTQEELNTINR